MASFGNDEWDHKILPIKPQSGATCAICAILACMAGQVRVTHVAY